jgi:hypothetical protein
VQGHCKNAQLLCVDPVAETSVSKASRDITTDQPADDTVPTTPRDQGAYVVHKVALGRLKVTMLA